MSSSLKLHDHIDPLNRFLDRYFFNANPVNHAMIVGPKGESKTYTAEHMTADYIKKGKFDTLIRIQGSAALDHAEFFGYSTPMPDPETGKMRIVWADGKFTEAFRLASNGKRVVVIIDEIKLIRGAVISPLMTSLVPLSDGKLHLNTGRAIDAVDGIAKIEELSCDTQNIRIIATANEGMGYQSNEMSIALEDRFIKYRQSMKITEFSSIVDSYCKPWRVAGVGCLPSNTSSQILKMREEQKKAAQSGALASNQDLSVFSVRTISRILSSSGGTTSGLLSAAMHMVFQHCEQDSYGSPITSQAEKHVSIILSTLGASVLQDDPRLLVEMAGGSSAAIAGATASGEFIPFKTPPGSITPNLMLQIVQLSSKIDKYGYTFKGVTFGNTLPTNNKQVMPMVNSLTIPIGEKAIIAAKENGMTVQQFVMAMCSDLEASPLRATIETANPTVFTTIANLREAIK